MAQAEADAPHISGSNPAPKRNAFRSSGLREGGFWALSLGSLGVVFGDIGTSPLYAFRESLAHIASDGTPATPDEIIGLVSLIFWALMFVVTLKYVVLVMQMDNKGEGGTLALMAMAPRPLVGRSRLPF